jgi:hypothetical protein
MDYSVRIGTKCEWLCRLPTSPEGICCQLCPVPHTLLPTAQRRALFCFASFKFSEYVAGISQSVWSLGYEMQNRASDRGSILAGATNFSLLVLPASPPTPSVHFPAPPPPIRATCPVHLILPDWIILVIFGDKLTTRNFSLCSFLQPPVTSSHLAPNVFLRTL